jgi:hypothetical protein
MDVESPKKQVFAFGTPAGLPLIFLIRKQTGKNIRLVLKHVLLKSSRSYKRG